MPKFPAWLRYGFPAVCFCMGTWQVYRLRWKSNLIRELEKGLGRTAIKLDSVPYHFVLHGKPELLTPIFLGPRSARDIDIDFAMQFILPYQLTDGQRVLLDYGRVPLGKEAEIKISETELYVECTLKSFSIGDNNPELGKWLYRDVEAMAKRYDTEPLMFQRISRRNGTGIPITGPPRIEISNRHMEYIITWYAMSAATLALGFLKH